MDKYGYNWPAGVNQLTIELWCYAHRKCSVEEKWDHFKNVVDLAFNCEGSVRRVVWNKWTNKMIRSAIGDGGKKRFLGIAGCSSSGKSDGFALYALVEFWSRPADTYVFVMSTTKADARKRIWRSVTQLYAQAQRMGCPGKLVDSLGVIQGVNKLGKLTRNSGIELVAAGKAEAGEASSGLIGIKSPNVVVIADEMPNLGDGILEAAWDNLTSNDRVFFGGLGNPNLFSDPFADLCEPIGGWATITEQDDEWKTKYGMCIRFNAELSPRITEPDGEKYFWQPDQLYCDRIADARGGKKSRGYYRFVKAFWCPEGAGNTIYQESEFIVNNAMEDQEPEWEGTPIVITALDPAFTRGGDRAYAGVAKIGKVGGRDHLHVCQYRGLVEDTSDKKNPLSHQLVIQWKELATDWGVTPYRATLDGTGSGISFGHIVDALWSPAVSKVNFSSKASGRKAFFRGKEVEYYNKNSELWIQPKEFIRGGQITGVSKELMKELCTRQYYSKETAKLRVESKDEHKKNNNGESCDIADMFLMLVDKSIALGMFHSEEVKNVSKVTGKNWSKLVKKKQINACCGRKLR